MTGSAQFIITLVAIIAAAAAPVGTMIAMTIHLGGRIDNQGRDVNARIDRLGDRVGAVEVQIGRFDERMTAGFERLETQLRDHAETHARLAHPH